MSRTKKDATEAIARLRRSFRGDAGMKQALDCIGRYVGDLRRKNSQQAAELGQKDDQLDRSRAALARCRSDCDALRVDLDAANKQVRQLHADLRSVKVYMDKAEEMISPAWQDAEANVPNLVEDSSLLKSVRANLRKAPVPKHVLTVREDHEFDTDKLYMFRIAQFPRTNNRNIDYATLGKFVAVSVCYGFPLGFLREKVPRMDDETLEKRYRPFWTWIADTWIASENINESLYYRFQRNYAALMNGHQK